MPCLYVAGKYLRIFAIKADKDASSSTDITNFDDTDLDVGQNKELENAARMLNRIFQTCLADRSVPFHTPE